MLPKRTGELCSFKKFLGSTKAQISLTRAQAQSSVMHKRKVNCGINQAQLEQWIQIGPHLRRGPTMMKLTLHPYISRPNVKFN